MDQPENGFQEFEEQGRAGVAPMRTIKKQSRSSKYWLAVGILMISLIAIIAAVYGPLKNVVVTAFSTEPMGINCAAGLSSSDYR